MFFLFFKLYLTNPNLGQSLLKYIELTYENINLFISNSIKRIVPFVYCFVCIFVVGVYIAIIIPMINIVSAFYEVIYEK